MEEAKPPRKKVTRPHGPEQVDGKRPGEEPAPATAERTDDIRDDRDEDSTSRQTPSTVQRPVTNQDEQDKVTNAGENDVLVNDK